MIARTAPAGEAGADDDGEAVTGEVVIGDSVPPVELLGLDSAWVWVDELALGETLAVGLVDVHVNAQSNAAVSSAVACKPRFIFVVRSLGQAR